MVNEFNLLVSQIGCQEIRGKTIKDFVATKNGDMNQFVIVFTDGTHFTLTARGEKNESPYISTGTHTGRAWS